MPCRHLSLVFTEYTGEGKQSYKRPTEDEVRQALQVSDPPQKKAKTSRKPLNSKEKLSATATRVPSLETFPAPLAFPDNELDHDPKYPPQSVQEWIDEPERNEITNDRNTVYVVPPPSVSGDVAFMNDWKTPQLESGMIEKPETLQSPRAEDTAEYLRAFYHDLPVKILKKPKLEFISWDADEEPTKSRKKQTASKPASAIGLSTAGEAIRIRTRLSQDGTFSGQLNLDDLLDTAISILPADAYALLMLVNQDLYENDDDDFCCGRAYGGSRVAVVSTARYHPVLDKQQKVNGEHSWPGSHCSSFIGRYVFGTTMAPFINPEKMHAKNAVEYHPGSALAEAVVASNALPLPTTSAELSALWFSRACKTASHELGHCFGIDHCTYYACVMQGTAHMQEDSEQPPYLCPVDLSKVLRATGAEEKDRYKALLTFCEKWEKDRMFAAFVGWIRCRMTEENIVPA